MSHPASSATSAAPLAKPGPNTKTVAIVTAIGATLLIGSEIWLAAIASLWALDGLLNLSAAGDIIMIALILPMALWATWITAKLAFAAETNPENAD